MTRRAVDAKEVELVYCDKCGRMIKKVCSVCGETISEKPCGCGDEVPGDRAS